MPRHIQYLLFALLLASLSCPAGAAESDVTARSIFALLPESIFENTPEGLSPQEKQKLLTDGHSEFWEVAGETEDVMVFASLPFRDTAVALRLLRNSSDAEQQVAKGGSFQMMLGGASSQMVRITLKLDDCCVPEISANKYALNIRFTRPDSEHRRQSDSSIDVPFDITFCNF